MTFRHSAPADTDAIMAVYESARRFMRESGNPSQWAGGYPPRGLIESDISGGCGFVGEEDGVIVCAFFFRVGEDETYQVIYGGGWGSDRPYGVIHRVACSERGKGVASAVFEYCLARCGELRIDTHRDNAPMRRALEKNGFIYCGIIRISDGSERLAFRKTAAEKVV